MLNTPPLILISNHDELYLRLMEELLTEAGYQVHLSTDPAVAYHVLVSKKPDLLIIDFPIMNPDPSWTTLNMTLLNPLTQNLSILICSTNINFSPELQERLEAMGIATLAKPFRLEAMLTKIRTLLDGQSPT